MRLQNFQRDAIVLAIFQDVPVAKAQDIHDAVQKALVEAMSPACQRAYRDCPKALKENYSYDLTNDRHRHTFTVGDADFLKVTEPWAEAKRKYEGVKSQLRKALDSCNTLKQLHERFPEFAAYFPTEAAPTKNLPALANLVTDIVNLGWKGVTK